ncbi:MAG: dockerin type I repeat-containing protein [Ruminococcus sp.]|nr:dockerin type I repeat-containing protein [Ruminococcus sp.]
MLNKKRKGLSGIALAVLVFMGTFNGFYSPYNAHASEDYRTWRQTDKRWSDIPMGYSNVGASGCLVTSISIMAAHSGSVNPDNFNPAVFVNALNGINGFTYGGSIASWSSVSAIIPDVHIMGVNKFTSSDQNGKADEIRSVMEDGYYVICNVGNHWVFVEDVTENDVYMIDPAKDDVLMFSSYNNYNITEYEILKGKNPSSLSSASANKATAVTTAFTTTNEKTKTTTTTTTQETTTSETTTTTTTEESTTSETTTTTTTEETTTFETTTTTTTTEETTTSETTTTTTTEETTIPETTSVPESVESISQTTESEPISEFYYSGEETTCIYTSSGEIVAEIETGNMVNVKKIENGKGLVIIDGTEAWIDMTDMIFNLDWITSVRGDINKDGNIDLYDLSLLNEYLKSLKFLPDGISILSQSEIETADINGDGVVDNGDVLEYLSIICK